MKAALWTENPQAPRLDAHSMAEDAGGELGEQAGAVVEGQLLENGVNALAAGVADGTEAVAGHGAGDEARDVGDDEAHDATARRAEDAPELGRRPVRPLLRHALLAQHLLEHVPELLVLRLLSSVLLVLLLILLRLLLLLLLLLVCEEIPRPAVEVVGPLLTLRRHRLVRVHVLERVRVSGRVIRLGPPTAVYPPLGVVVPAPGGVRQRVVSIIYQLKKFGSPGTVWRVCRDPIRVRFECRTVHMLACMLEIYCFAFLRMIGDAQALLAGRVTNRL